MQKCFNSKSSQKVYLNNNAKGPKNTKDNSKDEFERRWNGQEDKWVVNKKLSLELLHTKTGSYNIYK